MNAPIIESNKTTKQRKFRLRSLLSFPQIFNFYLLLIGFNNLRRKFVNEFIKPFPGATILDIGCGTASILDFLPDNVSYTGFDMNQRYISYASKKYLKAVFSCEEIKESLNTIPNHFDIVLASGVLHHLNDHEVENLFEKSRSSLKDGGYLMTHDPTYVENQSPITRFIISMDRGVHIRTPEEYLSLAKKYFKKVETTVFHDILRIPNTILFMKCYK